MKRCSKCHEIKSESEFYKDKRTKDGLKCQCKKCHCKTTVETRNKDKHRQSNKNYMQRQRKFNADKIRAYWRARKENDLQKLKARSLLNSAVRHGKIQRPVCCEKCGAVVQVYGHHVDYSKPLGVEWLCADCHGMRHRKSV